MTSRGNGHYSNPQSYDVYSEDLPELRVPRKTNLLHLLQLDIPTDLSNTSYALICVVKTPLQVNGEPVTENGRTVCTINFEKTKKLSPPHIRQYLTEVVALMLCTGGEIKAGTMEKIVLQLAGECTQHSLASML